MGLGGTGGCKDRRGLAGLDGDRERSRRLREDIMFFGGAFIGEGMRGAGCFRGGNGGSFALPLSERGGKLR